ncbi:hypothetical protein BV20DRAFT_239608 [Pilatotrama ljubarskyi]|nr:hypothetical protein BV20DRAFT_239608 [Pilatotrama ljubarskyi]
MVLRHHDTQTSLANIEDGVRRGRILPVHTLSTSFAPSISAATRRLCRPASSPRDCLLLSAGLYLLPRLLSLEPSPMRFYTSAPQSLARSRGLSPRAPPRFVPSPNKPPCREHIEHVPPSSPRSTSRTLEACADRYHPSVIRSERCLSDFCASLGREAEISSGRQGQISYQRVSPLELAALIGRAVR